MRDAESTLNTMAKNIPTDLWNILQKDVPKSKYERIRISPS